MQHFRDEIWNPQIFTHESSQVWLSRRSPTVSAAARALAREKIAGYSYELEPEKMRQIDKIFADYREAIN